MNQDERFLFLNSVVEMCLMDSTFLSDVVRTYTRRMEEKNARIYQTQADVEAALFNVLFKPNKNWKEFAAEKLKQNKGKTALIWEEWTDESKKNG